VAGLRCELIPMGCWSMCDTLDLAAVVAGRVAVEPLEADAAFVVTDSGGVQEETTALGVRCFTLRLDRTAGDGGARHEYRPRREAERLTEIPQLLERPKPGEVVPGWDGAAGARAAAVLDAALSA
jgi:UDP-N-acetylglucosamine 2-epimerase (non-hydrolysing)